MNTQVLIEVAHGVAPALAAGVLACAVILLMRKGKPAGDAEAGWIGALLLGVGCAAGAVWAGGAWKPGPSGTTWLPAMALLAGAAGLARGENERAGAGRWAVLAVALAGAAWMTVRSVAAMGGVERAAVMAGAALVGSAVCWGLERGVEEGASSRRGGWRGAAIGLIVGFAASQVLIVGMEVHTAAWVAAGVSAFFGVGLVAGLASGRAVIGRGVMATAGVLLCGLLVHGWQYGNAQGKEAALYGGLLALGAFGPALAVRVMGERGRGWGGVVACAVPSLAAVVLAAILRPPPLDV